MKKILILGGTGFVGRILTEELINAGNKPVLFNRVTALGRKAFNEHLDALEQLINRSL